VHVDDFVCSAATKRMKELQDSGCKVMLQDVPFVMAVTTPLMQRTLSWNPVLGHFSSTRRPRVTR